MYLPLQENFFPVKISVTKHKAPIGGCRSTPQWNWKFFCGCCMVGGPSRPPLWGALAVPLARRKRRAFFWCAAGFITRPRAASPPGAAGPSAPCRGRCAAARWPAAPWPRASPPPVARGRVLPRGRALRRAGSRPAAVWRRPPGPPGPWVLRPGVRCLRAAPARRGGPWPLPPCLGPGAALPGPPSPGPPLRGGCAALALAPPARGVGGGAGRRAPGLLRLSPPAAPGVGA